MKVFVTGGAGYLGSTLVPLLQEAGHEVQILDILCYGSTLPPSARLRHASLFDVRPEWLNGFDAVIHLAACSNDALADRNPEVAWRTNVGGSEHLIRACLQAGIPRFIYASTCSVYGSQPGAVLDETAPARPVGLYSEAKYRVEQILENACSATFGCFILRKPTLHGWSPRMRTDLVVNSMVKCAVVNKRIPVHNPDRWRPLLHVADASQAYSLALEAPISRAGVYNVNHGNYQLLDLAHAVQAVLRDQGCEIEVSIEPKSDPRDYRVCSEKIRETLHFTPRWNVERSVRDMLARRREEFCWASPEHVNVKSCRNSCNPASSAGSEA